MQDVVGWQGPIHRQDAVGRLAGSQGRDGVQTRGVGRRRRRRVFSLDPVEGFRPPVLTGHKDTPLAVFWAGALPPFPLPSSRLSLSGVTRAF